MDDFDLWPCAVHGACFDDSFGNKRCVECGNFKEDDMDPEYQAWIAENVKDPLGVCAKATLAMAEAFPELKRVRGHYQCWMWGDREHWWLVAPDGSIVDPTAAQFPTKGNCPYVEWVEGTKEPIGRCMNCGNDCYESKYSCSAKCERELMQSLRG